MTQPAPRERIENLWDRATPIGPLLDADGEAARVLADLARETNIRI